MAIKCAGWLLSYIYDCLKKTNQLFSLGVIKSLAMHLISVKTMLNKNTPGEKKSEAKSEVPVSSYSYM